MSNKQYLGEFDVNIQESPFAKYNQSDWAMYFIERYGQIDGEHHKTWVLDQVARIFNDTKVIVKLAKWDDGQEEYRVWLDEPGEKYEQWVKEMKGPWVKTENYEGYEYDYDEGIAP